MKAAKQQKEKGKPLLFLIEKTVDRIPFILDRRRLMC